MKKRNIKITQQMSADAKKMLQLMGLPVVEALSEAEAQCVAIVKAGKADAVASEDMDCLTFGAPLQLKGFNQRKEKRDQVCEIELKEVLKELDMSMEQFIDMCVLCGSDYTTKTIENLGPNTAFRLVKEHKTIEAVMQHLLKANEDKLKEGKKEKYGIPTEEYFNYKAAREEFKACRAFPAEEFTVSATRDRLNSRNPTKSN